MRGKWSLVAVAAFGAAAFAAGCSDNGPTSSGVAPQISQLQVLGVNRVSGTAGVMSFGFDFTDPDGDIETISLQIGNGVAMNPLPDAASRTAGTAHVLQSLDLPPTGGRVEFFIAVVDSQGHYSNSLAGSIIAPALGN